MGLDRSLWINSVLCTPYSVAMSLMHLTDRVGSAESPRAPVKSVCAMSLRRKGTRMGNGDLV